MGWGVGPIFIFTLPFSWFLSVLNTVFFCFFFYCFFRKVLGIKINSSFKSNNKKKQTKTVYDNYS